MIPEGEKNTWVLKNDESVDKIPDRHFSDTYFYSHCESDVRAHFFQPTCGEVPDIA